ncbi:MAG: permease [Gemmatimonadaceae bacterium]
MPTATADGKQGVRIDRSPSVSTIDVTANLGTRAVLMTSTAARVAPQAEDRAAIAVALLLVSGAVIALLRYKWSAASSVIVTVRETHGWSGRFEGLVDGGVLTAATFYTQKIWRALTYGLVIGAAVQTACRVTMKRFVLRDTPVLQSAVSSCAVGIPLMLCSCCITPLVVTLLRRQVRVGSALAILLASPVLNPAAIVLTFLLFPLHLSVARLVGACVLATLLPIVVQWRVAQSSDRDYLTLHAERLTPRTPQWTWSAVVKDFATNALKIAFVTIPLLALGVLASSSVMPFVGAWSTGLIGGFVVATGAVLVALPTFFEIPIAVALLASGSPAAAAAVLIAGPAVNVGSLMVISRELGPKAASLLALGVWFTACLSVLTFASASA